MRFVRDAPLRVPMTVAVGIAALLFAASACVPGVVAGRTWPASVAMPVDAWVCGSAALEPAYQPTLFVATDGDDSAAGGSIETPFRTLQRALDVARPGDVVWVRGGVYGADVEFRTSGLPGRPIVVESHPGECAIFDGSALQSAQRIRLIEVRHVVLRNIEVRNSRSEGIFMLGSHDVVISHVRTHHNRASGILSMRGDRNLFAYVIAHDNVDLPLGGDADGISISSGDGNRISYCVSFANSDDGIDTWRSTNTLVERCISFDNGRLRGDGNGFKLGGADLVVGTIVRDSIAFANRVDGFDYNSGRGIELERNTAFANGRYGFVVSHGVLRGNLSVANGAAENAPSERGNELSWNSWTLGLGAEVFVSIEPGDADFLRIEAEGGAARAGRPSRPDGDAHGHIGALAPGETIASVWGVSVELARRLPVLLPAARALP